LYHTRRRLVVTARIQNRVMMVKVLNITGRSQSLEKLHQGETPSLPSYQPFNNPTKKPKVVANTTGKI